GSQPEESFRVDGDAPPWGVGGPLRRARPDEAETLTDLAQRAKRHWGYPEEWIAVWRPLLTLTPAYIDRHEVVVAAASGAPLGFHALEPPGDGSGLWSLAHLWVDPDLLGRGLGRRLFAHAVGAVRAAGGRGLVIESDPHAVGFYERLGARRSGSVPAPMAGDPDRTLPVLTLTWGPGR
ncbi:MAG TPA: GNAT family N-acetyltransferase, partial [Gemmatimonadaceae bacterium]